MVKLVPMNEDEFRKELEKWISNYAQEKVISGNWKEDEAETLSRKEYAGLLPDGLNTKDQHVLTILSDKEENVGFIWFGVRDTGDLPGAFIWDFRINEEFRKNGYGSETLNELHQMLGEMGINRVSLHVFAHNKPAISLYEKLGYEATNIVMSREIRQKK